MREINYEIEIKVSTEEVFNALIKPSKIKEWWNAISVIVLPEVGGIYSVVWGESEDDPDYITISHITEIASPNKLSMKSGRYFTRQGRLPFESSLILNYKIEATEDGSMLKVHQTGIPSDEAANEFYLGCVQGWKDTFASIKSTLEK